MEQSGLSQPFEESAIDLRKKMISKPNNIFTKLFLTYALIILLSLLLFGIVLIYLFHVYLYNKFEETYSHHYEQVESYFKTSDHFNWSEEELTASLKLSLNQKGFSIFIFDSLGQVVYGPNRNQAKVVDKQLIEKAADGNKISKSSRVNGELIRVIASPLPLNMNEHNDIEVMAIVFHDLDYEYSQVVFMILITITIIIAFSGSVLWFISKKITLPLRDMNNIALKYAKGDFTQSTQVKTNDELGQLGETFNYMAHELNNLEEKRKDFIANVSHDLRSPLTSIKGFLIALLDDTIPDNRKDHYYLLMKDETERVIKLVNDTLDMTQLEEGHIKIDPKNYNLTKQLQMIVAKLEPHQSKKDIRIKVFPEHENIFVFADQDRIDQAIINLLQNALQFSPKKSEIKIRLEKHLQHIQITIQDQGEGISKEQINHIWKRFYKIDKARTNKAGAGIGLSIVKSIMDLHKTDISVKSTIGEGTTFSFFLPIAK
jgi:signal transduction histidine kinase